MTRRNPDGPPAAVIFDMDGVLVDSEPFIVRAAMEMFAEKGLRVRPGDFRPFVGAGEDLFLGGVAAAYRFPFDLEKDKARTYEIYLRLIRGVLRPLAGVPEFIGLCLAGGRRVAVASSADRVKVKGNLEEAGLPVSRFEAIVTGSEVSRKKPDPEIFLLAARLLGCRPSETLVVEDAPNGIIAGRAAGARCLGLTTSFSARELRAAGAEWCAPDLASVPPGALDWGRVG